MSVSSDDATSMASDEEDCCACVLISSDTDEDVAVVSSDDDDGRSSERCAWAEVDHGQAEVLPQTQRRLPRRAGRSSMRTRPPTEPILFVKRM